MDLASLSEVRPRQQHRPDMALSSRKRRPVALLRGLESRGKEQRAPVSQSSLVADGCDFWVPPSVSILLG
jgi:hypothetical protein